MTILTADFSVEGMPMRASQHPVAVNPLPWIFGSDFSWNLTEDIIRQALSDLGSVGFTALHADIPAGMSIDYYRKMLADYGFAPAPGYYGAEFDGLDDRARVVEAGRRAAAAQAELGLSEMFIASTLCAERRARPAVGTDADGARLAVITDGLIATAAAMQSEGVTAALHPHVGSWIETEDEVRAVLEASAGSELAFGPDTGHLAWAGIDPATLIADFRDRVVAVHVKDVDDSVRVSTLAAGDDYAASTFSRHVWTEPGRGSIDFDAVFACLPADFDGWMVIEVDVPNLCDKVDSARACFQWVRSRPELQASR